MKKQRTSGFAYISRFFYQHRFISLLLVAAVFIYGALSYTTLLRREGFPSVQIPYSFAGGTYFVDDADLVDRDVTKPLGELVLGIEGVNSVTTTASDNAFQLQAELDSSLSTEGANERIASAIESAEILPDGASIEFINVDAAKFLGEYDMLVSLYTKESATTPEVLTAQAEDLSRELSALALVDHADVQELLSSGVSPLTGQEVTTQTSFSRVAVQDGDQVRFFDSIMVGVAGVGGEDLDIFDLSDQVRGRISELNAEMGDGDYTIDVAADYTEGISTQIASLQNNILTGLVAITIVSFIMIGWRVSLVTAVFMLAVVLATLAILYIFGYTLNTITLFALVLSLGLFVDDATIISEAIDANKSPKRKGADTIRRAINGVGTASFAGTATTVLVFVPLLFIGGILGEFIFLMPLTVIISLAASFVLSITLIPFLSRYTILTKANLSKTHWHNPLPDWLASMVKNLTAKPKVGVPWAIAMIGLSVLFLMLSGVFASKLTFNIFPKSKDSDQLLVSIGYAPGTTIEEAETIADDVNAIVSSTLGQNLRRAAYGTDALPSVRGANIFVELTPFTEREVTAPQLVASLKDKFQSFSGASIIINQLDAGPPTEEFPFKVQVFEEDPERAVAVAQEVTRFLDGHEVARANGTSAHIVKTDIGGTDVVSRTDGKRQIQALGAFDAEDVSALVQQAQKDVEAEFTAERLEALGVSDDALGFDFGQESENEESFSTLGPAALGALGVMFVLLAIQFRSILKPLLIFLALPFSFLGVTWGLYISDNPLSFFAMVGLIGLIGIAVNNTILLVDNANQHRRGGLGIVESIAEAVRMRFRPLATTTATTVVALAPLAISDPFWEPLAVTIMFGLLSSTILVILAFPYYYIVTEFLTSRFMRFVFRRS